MNGFSGSAIYVGYYYALFAVNNTTLALAFMLIFDTEVDYDFEKYPKEKLARDAQKQLSYNPNQVKRENMRS